MKTLIAGIKQMPPYRLVRRAKRYVSGRLREIADPFQRTVSLNPTAESKGRILLSYILDPFLLKPGKPIPHSHTNYWESFKIAQTFLELGYSVDVIHYKNDNFLPRNGYKAFIDVRNNLQRLAPLLNQDCLRIMHIDSSHLLYANAAEARRLLDLQERRGITLEPWIWQKPNLAIESADCATILGNDFTCGTFGYAAKPLYRIPISSPFVYPWPDGKDFEACRKRFLWFGSRGLVHKGLDLVLEAFAGLPDYHLTVCGPITKDPEFQRAFRRELYETPNIETIGWVDVASRKFLEIMSQCIGLVYPSCSEGQCGGVVTCMHAGLIPVISFESGVDVHDFGMILPSCSIEEIQHSVRRIASLPTTRLEQMARGAWEYARATHTKEKFAEEYRRFVLHILPEAEDTGIKLSAS